MANQEVEIFRAKVSKVNLALNVLAANRLTVTEISLDSPFPRIDILPNKTCELFQKATSRWLINNGHRETEHVTLISGCQIRWKEY